LTGNQPDQEANSVRFKPRPLPDGLEMPVVSDRPVGITLLSILHTIGGSILLVVVLSHLPSANETEEALQSVGSSAWLVSFAGLFLAFLALGSGIGMFLRTRWGWWLAAFYYVHSILRSLSALANIISMLDEWEGTRSPEHYYVKHAGRIVLNSLILMYLFQGHVLRFFHPGRLPKAKIIGALVGAALAVSVLFLIVGALLD